MINLAAFTAWCTTLSERDLIKLLYHQTNATLWNLVKAELMKRNALKS